MPDVKIRRLPEWVVASFKNRAAQAGHSLEEELRQVLTDAAARRRQKRIESILALRERLRRKYGILPDSTPGIRADREARG